MHTTNRPIAAVVGFVLLIGLLGIVPAQPARASHDATASTVTLVGSLQSELGCSGDWDPGCVASRLTFDSEDDVWQGSFTVPSDSANDPSGSPWQWKIALNGTWAENYGAGGVRDGADIALDLDSQQTVKFYYDHETHYVTSSRNSRIVTAAGSFQSELGCTAGSNGGDWEPGCLRSWLRDPDGDGTYSFATDSIPAGSYEAKATINESWDENYGNPNGNTHGGSNLSFTVPAGGATVTFTFVSASNTFSIDVDADSGAGHDSDIWWNDLGHDSRDGLYRTPGGPVTTGTPVTLRLRAASGDLTSAHVRVWNDRPNTQSLLKMTRAADDGTYEWWQATIPASAVPTIYWYRFIARDGTATAYYEDDAGRTGGWGETFGSSPDNSWQLTVYDPAFETPDWVKNAVIYQIFPDRFSDGDSTNNALDNFFYGETPPIFRSGGSDWNTPICDPRNSAGPCPNVYSQNFYGGDLQGILDKLEYLQALGVTAIYLNPIFDAPSNHKYDTTDFTQIDPAFGDQTLFEALTAAIHDHGMHLILDGVFNHSSSDSIYFDRYGRYDTVGACESATSPYRGWYYFTDVTPGTGKCVSSTGAANGANYEAWFGYDSLPKLRASNSDVRDFFYSGGVNAVGPYWLSWADGWRLDVAGDVDPGLTNDPANDYWEGFRAAVRGANSEAYIVGEEWGMATAWTLGSEWDATMNYQLSSALLSFFRDTTFTDNDHNTSSSAGTLSPITAEQFAERFLNLEERYPPEALAAMMNLLGSHDTNRPLFMLDHNTHLNSRALYENPAYDWSDAITRLKGVVVLQGTLPGAPTVYYGDEVGLVAPPTYDGSTWQDDPYNRIPYPWLDQSGTPFYTHLQSEGGQGQLLDHYTDVFGARNAHPALRTGDVRFFETNDSDVIVFGRKTADSSDAAIVIVNRAGDAVNVSIDVSGYLPYGTALGNELGGGSIIVAGDGTVSVPAGGRSSGIFVTSGPLAAAPVAVSNLAVTSVGASTIGLGWSAVSGADEYDVYRSLLAGGGYELVDTVSTNSFGDSGLTVGTTYHYVVIARDSATGLVSGNSNEASATTGHDLSGSWSNVQWPPSLTHTISTTVRTHNVYGQIWIDGVTNQPGATPALRAQLGWGPDGSTPDGSWTWEDMTFNTDAGPGNNNDEFVGTLLPDQVGEFDYTVRYSGNNGATWQYAIGGPGGDETPENPDPNNPIRPLTVNPSGDTTAPGVPTLSLDGTTASSVSLSWTAPADSDLAGFELFRDGTKIATLGTSTLSYVDESVTTNETYEYTLKAYDTSFNRSPASNAVEATAENRFVDVTFTVGVPEYTVGTVYVTGSIAELGPWSPAAYAMTDNGNGTWSRTFQIPDGTSFEWKYTRGSWDTVEQWGSIVGIVNRGPTLADFGSDGTMAIDNTATNWGSGSDSDKAVQQWRDPLVVDHTPADEATGVATSTTVVVTFSKAMQANTTFDVSGPGGDVEGTFALSNDDKTVTFTPSSELAAGTEYSITVSGTQSAGGDNQQAGVVFSFTTVPPVDGTPPLTSDVSVVLLEGGQVNSAPVLLSWAAADGVTADEQLVHELQIRRRTTDGWTAWRAAGTVTGDQSSIQNVSMAGVRTQFRVRTGDEAGNWSAWVASNTFAVKIYQLKSFTFSGTWRQVDMPGATNGKARRSSTPGSTAQLVFRGDGAGWIMRAAPGQGTIEACIDPGTADEQCRTINLASVTPGGNRRLVVAFTGLANARHVLLLRVVSGMVNLDAALVSRQ